MQINPMCLKEFTIDSAFVDKYSDLGSDVITLFADHTVYKLSVSATDPMNPIFKPNGSVPLKEWSKGIGGPIHAIYYYRREKIETKNYYIGIRWYLWSQNKTIIGNATIITKLENNFRPIIVEKLTINPYELTQSYLYHDNNITVETRYHKGMDNMSITDYQLIPRLMNTTNNKLTVDEISRYFNQTTAGFAFNDYIYLFAGNRVCRMHNKTLHFDDNCLTQTIAQWLAIDCKDYNHIIIVLIIVILGVICLVTIAVILTLIGIKTRHRFSPGFHRKYKSSPNKVTNSSDSGSDDQNHNSLKSGPISVSLNDNRPTDLKIKIIVVLIKSLVVLSKSNPMCLSDFTIDSAFVDKYSDLGSDVITLFANNTVYKLSANTMDPMNPIFTYKESKPLNEWSKGIVGPITCVHYMDYGNIIGVENKEISNKWRIWSENKTIIGKYKPDCSYPSIIVEKLVILPFDWKRSTIYIEKDIFIQSDYWLIGSNRGHRDHMYLIRELKNNAINNRLTIDEIEGYLNETTAGFAFNDYFYLFAGNRVCRMHNRTLKFADNCLNQTIDQWIRCGEMNGETFPWLLIIIISITVILVLMTALMACLMYRVVTEEEEDITSKPTVYPKYKTVDQNVDTLPRKESTTSLSSASSDNRPTELAVKRSSSVKSMK
ncbi:unnamed protein product [Medioppia subpectinata]|uniref:Uncharacterized protein n=1 Tax=Medioppia subpectinata TaxID=1979941 RepID=A0A7R9PV13_9ACAR|nr:unnamed protein product [Medioppia subpectinata]CAG2102108.1 unnamed protein product [Medioppia subpectinata]